MEIRVVEEADGSIYLELETDNLDLSFELTEKEAGDLVSDVQAVLQDRWTGGYRDD